MNKINEIKKELKSIQGNFNPQKSTYKIIDDLINNNYSVNEMMSSLSKIKGVSKYPDDLKQKFMKIVDDLKKIEEYELNEKIRKAKELEKKEQEAKTKELKDLIDALETRKNNKKEKNVLLENKKEQLDSNSDNDLILDESSGLKKVQIKKEKPKTLEFETGENDIDKGNKLFKILLLLVIITFVIAVVIFFLY